MNKVVCTGTFWTLHKWTFHHFLKHLRTPSMSGSPQGLKGFQHVPGESPYPEVNIGSQSANLRLDPRFIYSKDSSITLIWMQHLWRREWRQAGAHLPWGWQLILSDSVSGCWAALHQTHLQRHQAVAWSGVHTNEDIRRRWLFVPQVWLADTDIKHLPAVIVRG